MNYIFDGKAFALKKEEDLKEKVEVLKRAGVKPKLSTILVGDDPASVLYVGLKKKAAERVGCELEIISCDKAIKKTDLINIIKKHNEDLTVDGIMVQLPLPETYSEKDKHDVLDTIAFKKDVDGLRTDTTVIAPATKAVLEISDVALNIVRLNLNNSIKILVVGATGNEGKKIIKNLKYKFSKKNINILGADAKTKDLPAVTGKADILISATGVPGLIKPDMVKNGAILIDVGSPKGDIDKEAYQKASFVSPVPGGVGPMTISCLLDNLITASIN